MIKLSMTNMPFTLHAVSSYLIRASASTTYLRCTAASSPQASPHATAPSAHHAVEPFFSFLEKKRIVLHLRMGWPGCRFVDSVWASALFGPKVQCGPVSSQNSQALKLRPFFLVFFMRTSNQRDSVFYASGKKESHVHTWPLSVANMSPATSCMRLIWKTVDRSSGTYRSLNALERNGVKSAVPVGKSA